MESIVRDTKMCLSAFEKNKIKQDRVGFGAAKWVRRPAVHTSFWRRLVFFFCELTLPCFRNILGWEITSSNIRKMNKSGCLAWLCLRLNLKKQKGFSWLTHIPTYFTEMEKQIAIWGYSYHFLILHFYKPVTTGSHWKWGVGDLLLLSNTQHFIPILSFPLPHSLPPLFLTFSATLPPFPLPTPLLLHHPSVYVCTYTHIYNYFFTRRENFIIIKTSSCPSS